MVFINLIKSMLLKLQTKESLSKIKTYVPGKSIKDAIKLSSNENALGASPKAIKAFKDSADKLFRYPDGSANELKKTIATKLGQGLECKNIIVGAGSDEIFSIISTAFLNTGENIIQSEYGFLMYAIYAYAHGAEVLMSKDINFTADVDAMLNLINSKTKIIYIANPNNPTGTFVENDKILKLINQTPSNILIVIDSAYEEYINEESYLPLYKMCLERENVIITKTFSKMYGLASLRLGYGIAHQNTIDILNKIRGPFNTSMPAQLAGIAALMDDDFVKMSKNHNATELSRVCSCLSKMGIDYIKSQGNFVMFKAGDDVKTLDEFLLNNKVIVRRLDSYNLNQYLRVTIGTTEENNAFLSAIMQFYNKAL